MLKSISKGDANQVCMTLTAQEIVYINAYFKVCVKTVNARNKMAAHQDFLLATR